MRIIATGVACTKRLFSSAVVIDALQSHTASDECGALPSRKCTEENRQSQNIAGLLACALRRSCNARHDNYSAPPLQRRPVAWFRDSDDERARRWRGVVCAGIAHRL